MVRKKIDNRIRVMIENGITLGHRTMFAVVGDKAKDQVVILHHMLTKAQVKARPSVLWCYKKELGFSSHRKKKMKSLQKKVNRLDFKEDDPFELFVTSTNIRYCYYKETHKILGSTYGMLVLQDFEALTPNLLARTIETVEGGGLVVLLCQSVTSLKQLFTMTMDVHARYRTEAQHQVIGRFNERFILSLADNKRCAVMDDSLNILPLSSHVKHVSEVPPKSSEDEISPEEAELKDVKEKFQDHQPTGSLLNLCKTVDQAKAILEFIDAITDKKLDRTVSLTAARGRGKSAALGLAIAAAVGFRYSNIFVTSPSPENLQTLFDFIFKGFDAMGFEEHTDYDIIQSTNPEFNNAIVRINIHDERADNSHRQVIQYLHPSDAHKLGQAELLVIDEAAAIPLPLVKNLLGPYLVFMSSTINGYEGTGRSLSLKLLDQLRQQSNPTGLKAQKGGDAAKANVTSSRALREVSLEESIRYRPHDEVEKWLNQLLCLDATNVPYISSGTPSREDCDLYYINRDTLFCYHRGSEQFLQRIMALFVASHYKNTPDDLQLLSDAPAHHIFCLLGPTHPDKQTLPEVLCVVQVCLEGAISKKSVHEGLRFGNAPSGDMIPWNVARQFQDDNFPSLSGARIVRIATHPNYQSMGYGSRALELLQKYYEMKIPNINDHCIITDDKIKTIEEEEVSLLEENIKPRKNLPPLLSKLSQRKPEKLDYLGVSYGLTQPLLKFWRKAGFTPVYISQVANNLTGEHTTIMIKPLKHDENEDESTWLRAFYSDFRRRLVNLLGYDFRAFSSNLVLPLLMNKEQKPQRQELSLEELSHMLTPYDLGRLKSYTKNMVEYRLILDLVPTMAKVYFLNKVTGMGNLKLMALQKSILIGIGLQFKSIDKLSQELDLQSRQLLGQFKEMMRQMAEKIEKTKEEAIRSNLLSKENALHEIRPALSDLGDELTEAAEELKDKQKESLINDDLQQYKVKGSEAMWSDALSKNKKLNLISVQTGQQERNGDKSVEIESKKRKMKDKQSKKTKKIKNK